MAVSHSGNSHLSYHVNGKSLKQLMDKGRDYYVKNQLDSALFMFSVVAEKYDERMSSIDKELCLFALNDVGVIHAFGYFDYVSGYNNFSRALDLAVENGLKNPESVICLNMAELFMNYYRHFKTDAAAEKILEYSKRGFQKAYESQHYECMGGIVVNLLSFDLNTPTDDFNELFNEDIKADSRNIAYARGLMKAADIYKQGRYAEAREALKDAFKLMNSKWNPERYSVSLAANIADTYIAENDIASAEKCLLEALAEAEALGNIDQQLGLLSTLSQLDVADSESYKLQYLEKFNKVMSTGRLQIINELDFLKSLSDEQKKSAQLFESRRKLLTYLVIGSVLFLVVLGFTVVVARLNSKLRERNRALYRLIRTQMTTDEVASEPKPDENHKSVAAETDKYSGQSIKDEKIDEIYRKIEEVMLDNDAVSSPDFTLSKLSTTIGVNTTYVSRVINEKHGCSFSSLVSERRIRIACARMDDHVNYKNLTIEAISKSVGFASRNTFVNAFKKVNGMTPSEYLKASREFANKTDEE